MSDEINNRKSVREISSLFNSEKSIPTNSIGNVTVGAIKKRHSFKVIPPNSDTSSVTNDSNIVELRKKYTQSTRSLSNAASNPDLPPLSPRSISTNKTETNTASEENPVEMAVDALADMETTPESNDKSITSKNILEKNESKINIIGGKQDRISQPNSLAKTNVTKEINHGDVQEPSTSDSRLSVSLLVGAINSIQPVTTRESIQKIDATEEKDTKLTEKDLKIIKCRLILKNEKDTCSWNGPRHEFQQHCKENHAHQLALSASESVAWASTKLYTNTVSVRIFDDEIFWCYHRVAFDESSKGTVYWAVITEGIPDHHYVEVAFYLKGNIYKKMIFSEWCLWNDTNIESAFNCKRCIAIPKDILQLYFGVGEDYMDLLFCEATIKRAAT